MMVAIVEGNGQERISGSIVEGNGQERISG
jgi:hypothetical protein